jgi:hypothetical protein
VLLERRLKRALGDVPLRVGAEPVLGARREFSSALDAEELVQVADVLDDRVDLRVDLLLRTEDMGVVLVERVETEEPVQRARRLIAMQRPGLGESQRKIAVAMQPASVHEHVTGTVHRLEPGDALALLDQEEQIAVLLPMARRLPELGVVHERRLDLQVAALRVLAPP